MGFSDRCIMYAGVEPAVLNGGAVLCHPEWPVPLASRIIARLLVLDVSRPILRGQQVLLTVWCLALGSFEMMLDQACMMSAGVPDSILLLKYHVMSRLVLKAIWNCDPNFGLTRAV